MTFRRRAALVEIAASFSMLAFLLPTPEAVADAWALRIYTDEPGVHRLTWEDLTRAGWPELEPATDTLALTHAGEPVPIWIDDGEDGRFGPGDSIELVAEPLHGEASFHHEYSRENVYWLRPNETLARRMHPWSETSAGEGSARRLLREVHVEEERLLARIGSRDLRQGETPDLWYWHKLSHLDDSPFAVDLDLSGLDREAPSAVELSLSLRGLSSQRRPTGEPDHRVEIRVDGRVLAQAEWDGRVDHQVDLPPIDPATSSPRPRLELRIPKRQAAGQEADIVDLVLVNWVEGRYPHRSELARAEPQRRLSLDSGDAPSVIRVTAEGSDPLRAYGDTGSRTLLDAGRDGVLELPVGEERRAWFVAGDRFLRPARIEVDRPSSLRSRDREADLVIIAHETLVAAVGRLAEMHEREGLRVAVVDVQDVYDEFHHGIPHPRAIRDFIRFALDGWREPELRYVLLVGDASWDTKNAVTDDANYANWSDRNLAKGPPGQFHGKKFTRYPGSGSRNDRNLIPTWHHHSREGHSGTDNPYADVRGDDDRPDVAVGRLPVTLPEEVEAITRKIQRYTRADNVGVWRARILWVTNESTRIQERSDGLALEAGADGWSGLRIYPSVAEASNESHQSRLARAFDEGQFLVHFVGHGGRFIWRTGPPDLRKNHDLFGLDDLDGLQATSRLPVVLSMSCHTGPFDHPSADSIAEKLLRLDDRGAIAVVAASWRNPPSPMFSRALVESFRQPGRVGDAFLRAKQRIRYPDLLAQYNLLGDPAVPLAVPQGRVAMTFDGTKVTAEIPFSDFRGRAYAEWVDAKGTVLHVEERTLGSRTATFALPEDRGVRRLRVYVWDTASGRDALGAVDLGLPAVASERENDSPSDGS